MNTNANGKKGLTIRDLVTIGIFSALFLVFALVGGIFFAPNPVLPFPSMVFAQPSGLAKNTRYEPVPPRDSST